MMPIIKILNDAKLPLVRRVCKVIQMRNSSLLVPITNIHHKKTLSSGPMYPVSTPRLTINCTVALVLGIGFKIRIDHQCMLAIRLSILNQFSEY